MARLPAVLRHVVMRSGAVSSLLGATEVTGQQVEAIKDAVREGDLEQLDGVLVGLLRMAVCT